MFRTEKAFPEEAAVMKLERGAHSSFVRCSVFDTNDEIAEYDKGSTLIQVGRALMGNIFRTLSTTSLVTCVRTIGNGKVERLSTFYQSEE